MSGSSHSLYKSNRKTRTKLLHQSGLNVANKLIKNSQRVPQEPSIGEQLFDCGLEVAKLGVGGSISLHFLCIFMLVEHLL